ncbi:MAG: hypothetical protein HY043_01115 [Verrucomicrobia bacterium]|nr:hypothetical protein [Verrucomicrobiota bacterium]
MSYVTLEAEIAHGEVVVKEPGKLPESAHALVTILGPVTTKANPLTPIEALDALQKHLQLDQSKAADWKAIVHDARR